MPLKAEAIQILKDINSWWAAPHEVRPRLPSYERRHVQTLLDALSHAGARCQVLRGPRQAGKSTVMLQAVRQLLAKGARPQDILLIRFDLDILREQQSLLPMLSWFAKEIRGSALNEGRPFYLFLDEAQKLPRWDEQIKHVFDTYKPRMALTGSASVLVARGQRESLAGRALTTEIPPFLFREVLELTGDASDLPKALDCRDLFQQGLRARERFEMIFHEPPRRRGAWKDRLDRYYSRGGYPDLHTGAIEEDRWADYLMETVFERVLGVDIPDLFPVDQPRLLRHIYMEAARRTGQEIAQKKLADEANAAGFSTNQPTVGRYLHYLCDALLIREFRRYPLSRKVSAKIPSKYTLTDLGVRNAIFRETPSLWDSPPDALGPLVETLVQTVLRGVGIQAHFYRQLKNPNRRREGFEEVDFIIEALDGSVIPIEVKFRRRIDGEDCRPLINFMKERRPNLGIMVTRETFNIDQERKILFVPLMDFLLAF